MFGLIEDRKTRFYNKLVISFCNDGMANNGFIIEHVIITKQII